MEEGVGRGVGGEGEDWHTVSSSPCPFGQIDGRCVLRWGAVVRRVRTNEDRGFPVAAVTAWCDNNSERGQQNSQEHFTGPVYPAAHMVLHTHSRGLS
jgi:hypothetical protein